MYVCVKNSFSNKIQNDEASSNYNFDRYQKSKCSGMSYRQLGKTFINVSTMAFSM